MSRLGIFVDRQTFSSSPQLDAVVRCRDIAERMGHNVDFIFPLDLGKIHNLDALFIRARTDPMNITYVAAQIAAFHGIPVIDDPDSIRICSDKINMYSHLMERNVPIPKTVFLSKNDLTTEQVVELFEELGYPLVIKEPSTSFSMRVEKVHTVNEFFKIARRFIKLSDWIVVQQYIESRYDWRVGVLDGNPLYGCKYIIASDTFKIQGSVNGHVIDCEVERMGIDKIPSHVIQAGIDAANAIGHGLYGVDIKNNNGDAYVIEVNDNPSIEHWEDNGEPFIFEQVINHLLPA